MMTAIRNSNGRARTGLFSNFNGGCRMNRIHTFGCKLGIGLVVTLLALGAFAPSAQANAIWIQNGNDSDWFHHQAGALNWTSGTPNSGQNTYLGQTSSAPDAFIPIFDTNSSYYAGHEAYATVNALFIRGGHTLTVAGGTLEADVGYRIGELWNALSTLNITGGRFWASLPNHAAGYGYIGGAAGKNGLVHVSGGIFESEADGTTANHSSIGNLGGTGTLRVSGSGDVDYATIATIGANGSIDCLTGWTGSITMTGASSSTYSTWFGAGKLTVDGSTPAGAFGDHFDVTGEVLTLKAAAPAPMALTGVGVSNATITATDATVYADLASPDTTVSSSQVWVVWSDDGDQGETLSSWPATNELSTYWATGTTATATFGGALSADTTYTFRLFATNSGPASASAWSAAESFYAQAPAPVTNGLVCWLAADKLELADGDPVPSFTDRSGSGNHANNAVGGGGTYVANVLNGEPVVRFDTTEALYTDAFNPLDFTILYVAKMQEVTGTAKQRILSTSTHNELYGFHNTFQDRMYLYNGQATHWTTPAAGTDPHLYVATVSSGASTLYDDGTSLGTAANAIAAATRSLQLNGWNGGTTDASDCDVAEVLVYNRILTASELNEVGYYLEEKYGFATRYTPSSGALYLDDIGVSNATITTIDATVYADLGSPDASVSSSQVWVVWSDVGDQGTNALSAWPNTNELSTFWTTGTTVTATFGGALSGDTTYTFRMFATNSGPASSFAWSDGDSFTTQAPLELNNVGVSNATITASDATVYADVDSPLGSVSSSQVWVVWSDAGDQGTTLSSWPNTNELSTYWATGTTATATFGDALSANTTYTFRLFATNSGPASKSAWSDAASFFAQDPAPVTNGLVCWLAADKLEMTNGEAVTSFLDRSGSGNHADNALGGGGTLTTSEINGKPVVRFTTAETLWTTTSWTMPYTLIHVAKMQEVTGTTKLRLICSGSANRLYGYHGGFRDRCFMGGWHAQLSTAAGTSPHIYAFTVTNSATGTYMYGDGSLVAGNAAVRQDLGTLRLNGWDHVSAHERSDCDVAEVLVYNRILTSNELNEVGYYLEEKYGLSTAYVNPDPEIDVVTPSPLNITPAVLVGATNDTHFVTVTNLSGGAALNITNFYWTGDTNEFSLKDGGGNPTGQVAIGSSTNIYIEFVPTNIGARSATLYIQSDDPGTPLTNITINGTGAALAPDISLSTTSLDYGVVLTGSVQSLTVTVDNIGTSDLTISNITFSGSNTYDFASNSATSPPNITVASGGSTNIVLEYTPGTSEATHTGSITIQSDDPDSPSTNVSVTGTAVGAFDLIATANGATLAIDTDAGTISYDADGAGPGSADVHNATIANNLATWTFGDINIGTSGDVTITTLSGTNAIKIIANGQGVAGTGDITIQQNLAFNGKDGGGQDTVGGARSFGSGAGGDDYAAGDWDAEGGKDGTYTRGDYSYGGGGISVNAVDHSASGGGFGGNGGSGMNEAAYIGLAYGRMDLAELGTASGPVGGSGGGGTFINSGGSGGGAVQFFAIGDITVATGVSITADGGEATDAGANNRQPGSGSGGAIRFVADSDLNGSGTLSMDSSTLSAQGGTPSPVGSRGGPGGGGRIVIRGVAGTTPATTDVDGGTAQGAGASDGGVGSVLIDTLGGALSLSGGGTAANVYSNYTSLGIASNATLELGGAGSVATATISNNVTILGTLAIDVNGSGAGSADKLTVTGALDITGATLDTSEIVTADDDTYVIAQYAAGQLTGTFTWSGMGSYYLIYTNAGNTQIVLQKGIPDVSVDPTSLSFGTIGDAETKDLSVTVSNSAAATGGLTITNLTFFGGESSKFSIVSPTVPPSISVSPGQITNIVVRYTPSLGEHGSDSSTLRIWSNDPTNPTNVPVSGIAESRITIDEFQAETSTNYQGAFETVANNGTVFIYGPDLPVTNEAEEVQSIGDPYTNTWTFVLTNATLDTSGSSNDTMTWTMQMLADDDSAAGTTYLATSQPGAGDPARWTVENQSGGFGPRIEDLDSGVAERVTFIPGTVTYELNDGATSGTGSFLGFESCDVLYFVKDDDWGYPAPVTATIGGETVTWNGEAAPDPDWLDTNVTFSATPGVLLVDSRPHSSYMLSDVAFSVSTNAPSTNLVVTGLDQMVVLDTSARLGAVIETAGGTVDSYGVGVYTNGGSTNLTTMGGPVTVPPALPFMDTVSGLQGFTLYNFRGWASNASDGLVWTTDSDSFTTEPAPPSNLTFSAVTHESMTIDWMSSGGSSLAILRQGYAVSSGPVDGTAYTAGAAYTDATTGESLLGGGQVVYSGVGNSVSVSNLADGVKYYVEVYGYDVATTNYSSSAAASNQTMTGGITWRTEEHVTNGTSIVLNNATGTLVEAVNFTSAAEAGTPRVINFVTFEGRSTAAGTDWKAPGYGSPADYYQDGAIPGDTSGDFAEVMNSGMLMEQGPGSPTLALTNLTVGQSYYVQIFHSDDRSGAAKLNYVQHLGDGNVIGVANDPAYAIVGTFTASGTTARVAMRSNGRSPIMGYQVRTTTAPTVEVTNLTVTGITDASATLGAMVIAGGTDVTSYGTGYYLASGGATQTLAIVSNLAAGASRVFSHEHTGLTKDAVYNYRGWASNSTDGVVWSADEGTFTAVTVVDGSRIRPAEFNTIGDLTVTNGTIVFDTDARTVTTNGTQMGTLGEFVQSASGDVELTLFNFDDVSIGTGVSITVTGNLGLVIGSTNDITLASDIGVSGSDAVGGAIGIGGPGAEGGVMKSSTNSAPPNATAGNGGNGGEDGVGYGAGEYFSGNNCGGGGAGYGGDGAPGADFNGYSTNGFAYGDLMLADLLGGSGGGGGIYWGVPGHANSGEGGGGGGTIELTAVGTITLGASLFADGGNGRAATDGGGGASGGAILLSAATIDLQPASLGSATGGDGGNGDTWDGGSGGGGRIALYANTLTLSGSVASHLDVQRGALNDNGGTADDGSIYIDVQDGMLYLSGNGTAANTDTNYAAVTVTNGATLSLNDAGTTGTVTATSAAIIGTLAVDLDGAAVLGDRLNVSGALTLTGATLDVTELVALPYGTYITLITHTGARTGTFDTMTQGGVDNGRYDVRYLANEVQVGLLAAPTVFIFK